ncbi:MAG: glycoside hydrolase family 5 protein, partial [Candidatus Obscuribacterales bacterium]|nr:glycoside hydrolase family 5 protein [Candidatus Obscuribacterales bacterium]
MSFLDGCGPKLSQRICVKLMLSALALIMLPAVTANDAHAAGGGMKMEGVNISGAEWGTAIPGTFGVDYIFPTPTEIDYFSSKGMNTIRVGIWWERIQPAANGALEPVYLGRLDSVIKYATSKGMKVIIDLHNFGEYRGVTIGVPGGQPNSMFANFWSQIATKYLNNNKVIFDIMNEPVGNTMTATTWLASAQAAIDAIRQTGNTNLILVPSTYWEHPVNFVELNGSVMYKVKD